MRQCFKGSCVFVGSHLWFLDVFGSACFFIHEETRDLGGRSMKSTSDKPVEYRPCIPLQREKQGS